MITLTEYHRRFEGIVEAFRVGHFTADEASAAMRELTRVEVKR